jgi:hypothetical protein
LQIGGPGTTGTSRQALAQIDRPVLAYTVHSIEFEENIGTVWCPGFNVEPRHLNTLCITNAYPVNAWTSSTFHADRAIVNTSQRSQRPITPAYLSRYLICPHPADEDLQTKYWQADGTFLDVLPT